MNMDEGNRRTSMRRTRLLRNVNLSHATRREAQKYAPSLLDFVYRADILKLTIWRAPFFDI